ncbi:lecithin--cholesterol acyltransferase [Pleurocapsa sp. PCC 7319]|uniref:lipase/acyltransferase domain-containing protein n=1 Tax=Pleurocapsa sp. PCC 7319 TaxID=118161 RepID=UPI00034C5331|nr:lecithin--cholesterol acyltransferase [Pleurocapsa sp. PCC 7319]
MPTEMKDMVVILPGIMGSILQKDGKDLWNVSGQAIWQVVRSLGDRLGDLKLEGDDPEGGNLDDGVIPTGLIQDTHLIPGLWKIDGYDKTSKLITDNFKVIKGDIYQDPEDQVANFYYFPYDWRRDNRANANILKRLLDKRLKTWRESSGNSDAKVILLAHSMGGLISRYYLEVLGGWKDARALFTFGTPYRGSVNAIDVLANGFRKQGIDLLKLLGMREIINSLTSIYQLLPIYPVLQVDGASKRVAEVANLPNIDQEKANQALAFHREIEAAVKTHSDSYATVPFVGIQQPTLQSAEFTNGKITVGRELPLIMKNRNLASLADGDGTVPQISAFPIEFSDRDVLEIPSFIAEAHGSLQNQPNILLNLLNKMQVSQDTGETLEDIRGRRGKQGRSIRAGKKGISLLLDDLYLQNEPILIKAKINGDEDFGALKGHLVCVSERRPDINLDFVNQSNEWSINSEILNLEPGLYRLKVTTEKTGENSPNPVHDLFEVADINS